MATKKGTPTPLPCPCGCKAVVSKINGHRWSCRCINGHFVTVYAENEREAIKGWNEEVEKV